MPVTESIPANPVRRSMDIGFVLDLPDQLRDVFNHWAASRGFDPNDPRIVDAAHLGRTLRMGDQPDQP